MASREEEKRRRREEREAAEREAARRDARSKRLRIGGGLALLAVIAAGVIVALAARGGDEGPSSQASSSEDLPTLPAVRETDLEDAAKAAGCRLQDFPAKYQSREHVEQGTKLEFETNPPAYGTHYFDPASDGNYVGQGTPAPGNWIHSLEHGRIQYQYRPGVPQNQVRQLEALFEEKPDLVQVFENNTRMKGDVAAVAWTHILSCPSMNPRVFDAFRAFRDKYTLKAPEVIPQPQ